MTESNNKIDSDICELEKKSLEMLDFPAILEKINSYITFEPSRKLVLNMLPSYSFPEVEILLRETAEGLILLEEHKDVSFNYSEDVSATIEKARLGGLLSVNDLLNVSKLLATHDLARRSVVSVRNKVPTLATTVSEIPELHEIQTRITYCINRSGYIVDDATPTLGKLRNQVRQAYERITDALLGIIHSTIGKHSLQNQIISTRGDRVVLQVKQEQRHQIPGIVHSTSNTGSTLFVEPIATVNLCNKWRELVLEEEKETSRIIRDLSALVGTYAVDINRGSQITARLDSIMAKARYSETLMGSVDWTPKPPDLELPNTNSPNVKLLKMTHPLLGKEAVPINVQVGPGWSTLVITGPNTGGKTVAMKTVGLLALMHQSGIHIPTGEGSVLPVFTGVYADIGDRQNLHHSQSSFGSHIQNIIRILSQATPSSLILLDEIGASTDPEEGAALAKAILSELASKKVPTIATTHYRDVAAYAQKTAGIMNACVELEEHTLNPTYHLILGAPSKSYGLSVAERLGMPSTIMSMSQSLLSPLHIEFEHWISELQDKQKQLQARLMETDTVKAEAEVVKTALEKSLSSLTSEHDDIVNNIRADLSDKYDNTRKKLRRAEAAMSWNVGAKNDRLKDAKVELESAKKDLTASIPTLHPIKKSPHGRHPAVGDTVQIRGLNVQGKVVSIPEIGEEAEIVIGKVHLRIATSHLVQYTEPEEPNINYTSTRHNESTEPLAASLDIRGYRVEEALLKVERFLDTSLRDGLISVHIIHGEGTGALRESVRALLTNHPLAKSYHGETSQKRGDGVTTVELI